MLFSPLQIYDFLPSVSKDVSDGLINEETYNVPPHFAKENPTTNATNVEPSTSKDVYDVLPPLLADKPQAVMQEIYDIPSNQQHGGVYDIPCEHLQVKEEPCDYIYDVPPLIVQDTASVTTEELTVSFKRLSVSSTGSSNSSHDTIPVRESSVPGHLLSCDLDHAMEQLSHLQQAVETSASMLMSFVSSDWRSPAQMEHNLPSIREALECLQASIKELLEFSHGAVANASQATLQAKLSKQVQKMDDNFQDLLKHNQALDVLGWTFSALPMISPNSGEDDLDRLVMCARAVPDDTKQLASFLHGNATLLFRRTNKQQHDSDDVTKLTSNVSIYQSGKLDRSNIQSRPLPSPPKFTTKDETAECPYVTEEGWMEDYDYVHLQVGETIKVNLRLYEMLPHSVQ